MSKIGTSLFFLLLAIFIFHPTTSSGAPAEPLRASELMALVAGDALSENIVHELSVSGISFRLDDAYRAQLKAAGADNRVLSALDTARVVGTPSPASESEKALLQHLSAAGSLVRATRYTEAAQELKAALTMGVVSPESGFVMGQLLRVQERFPEAVDVYSEVLHEDANFPEAHTKLSYILYRLGIPEESLQEAKAALAQNPENAEAHKNAGLALALIRKFDAAEHEFREALRAKHDYEAVQYDLGILLHDKGDVKGSIAAYKKALALNPKNGDAHNNLGIAFKDNGDIDSAIHEYREAKRLDPSKLDVRQNLGAALMAQGSNGEAVKEFRELEAMAPDLEICHQCLGDALFRTWDFEGAEKEYRVAAKMDPMAAGPHIGLGSIREEQKKYAEALDEYREAESLDGSFVPGPRGAGRVLLAQRDFTKACEELNRAVILKPSDANDHDLYGQALLGAGHINAAIGEFKESIALDPKQFRVMVELAATLEKKGDFVAALDQYRRAALAESSRDLRNQVIRVDELADAQNQYKAAQQRINDRIASLKAAGKASEAADLENRIQSTQAAPNISMKLDATLQTGAQAASERRTDEALRSYKEAVTLGEQIQPHDQRLILALDHLGNLYMGQDFPAAQAAFAHELKVAEELYGPQSSQVILALQSLGTCALLQHDYATSEKFYFTAVDVTVKAYGETSDRVADSLRIATRVYIMQGAYEKAEPYLLRAVNIDEALLGRDNEGLLLPLATLCSVYDKWGKADKSEPCDRHLIAILEKKYGASSPVLVSTLVSEAQALRNLGRADDAAKVEKRLVTIRSATMKTN